MAKLRLVHTVLVGVVAGFNLHVAEFLLGMGTRHLKTGEAINGINGKTKAINLIIDGQLKGVLMLPFSL